MSTISPGKLRHAMSRNTDHRKVWHDWQSFGREPSPATFQVLLPITGGATSGPAFDAAWFGVALGQYPNQAVEYAYGASIAQACTANGEVAGTQLVRLQRVIAAARNGHREAVLANLTDIAKAFNPDGARRLRDLTARWSWELEHPWSRIQPGQELTEVLVQDTESMEAALGGL